jgi:hypothetical protein
MKMRLFGVMAVKVLFLVEPSQFLRAGPRIQNTETAAGAFVNRPLFFLDEKRAVNAAA